MSAAVVIPISFVGDMVRAILEDRKLVTRRVIKDTGFYCIDGDHYPASVRSREREALAKQCPYGQPGDILRVRESFRIRASLPVNESGQVLGEYLCDRATFETPLTDAEWEKYVLWRKPFTGKPPMYMFRSLSRLWLQVVSVRVERVQDITEEDAKADGAREWCEAVCFGSEATARAARQGEEAPANHPPFAEIAPGRLERRSYRLGFEKLWDSINATRGHSWASNPWVWRIEFRRVKKP